MGKLLMETQAEVKRKTHLKLGQKSPGEQFAELLMSKAAKLQQHSNLTYPELKHSLTKLYNVNDLNASIIKSSLGFQEEGPLDENQELEQMPKLNENQQQPCSREHIKIPLQEREEFYINLRGINLKPARKVPMDKPDNKPDDEIQGATANQDKKLLDMINDLILKPIDKETKAPFLKDIPEETLHTAITRAKSAVHSDSNIKHQKKSQISKDFVDILLKELPISTLPSQVAKDDLVSKIEDMSSIEMVDPGNLKKVWTSIQTDMTSHQDKKELTSAKLEETYKDTLKKLKPTLRFESEKRPAVHHFSELFLTSLPEIAASSSLTETQLLTSLADLHSKSPKSGDEIKERLGLVDIDDPSPLPKSGEVFMNDQDLEKLLRETQAEVKRKPHLKLGQKSAAECFAELLLSKAPTLKQHSNLTEPDLRLNIAKLYNLKALNAATVKSTIGVHDGGHLAIKPELKPSIAHTKKDIQPGIIDQIKMPAQEKEELATSLWGTNLKPVRMVPIEEADKSKDEIVHLVDDEKLGATAKYDNNLIEMIKDFRLKPINKETKAPNLKDIPEETLNSSITKAKSAVCQNIDMKPRKKSEITQDFVDVLLRELPVSTLPSQVTKDALVSKIENMSSIEMVNPSNLKKEWRSIETGKSSHPVK